jgi:hypothetical protein
MLQKVRHFAARVQPPVQPLPEAGTRDLQALVARRQQLVLMHNHGF